MTPSLMIQWKLNCRSRKQQRKNKPITVLLSGPCDCWFRRFCFRLRQSTFHWKLLDRERGSRKYNGIRRKGTFWFIGLRFRRDYNSDFTVVSSLTIRPRLSRECKPASRGSNTFRYHFSFKKTFFRSMKIQHLWPLPERIFKRFYSNSFLIYV